MKVTNKDESVVNTEKAVKSSTQSTESSASKNSSKAMDATKKNYKKANSSTKHSPIDVKKLELILDLNLNIEIQRWNLISMQRKLVKIKQLIY